MAFSIKHWLNPYGTGTAYDQPTDTGDTPDTPVDAAGLRDLESRLSAYTDSTVATETTARGSAVSAEAAARAAADTTLTTAVGGKADLSSGHVPLAQLGSGTPASGKYVDGASGAWLSLPAQSGSVPVVTVADAGAALTLTAPAAGEKVYDVTFTEACEITLTGGSDGQAATLTVIVRSGGFDVTWPEGIGWTFGAPPVLSTEDGQSDVIVLLNMNAGGAIVGFLAGPQVEIPTPPTPAAPAFTVDPVISGTGVVGDTLTCDGGSVTGVPTPTKTYQWKNAGVAISGATASTYVVVVGDVGDALTCTVTADNGVGSPATATSNSITGAASPTAPGAPTSLSLSPGSGQLGASWVAPASNGGSAITTYLVEYRTPNGSGSYTTFAHSASTTPSITITGLTNGSAYGVRVSAVNAIGTGAATSEATATPTGGGGFDPATISWAHWHKPESLPGSGSIATWADETTNSRDFTQATTGSKPTVEASALNGFKAAVFDGGDFMATPSWAPAVGHKLSFVAVVRLDAAGTFPVVLGRPSTSGELRYSNTTRKPEMSGLNTSALAASPQTLGTWAILIGTWEQDVSLKLWVNGGAAVTTNDTGMGGTGVTSLGARSDGTLGFTGAVAEVFVIDDILTLTEINDLGGNYLAAGDRFASLTWTTAT